MKKLIEIAKMILVFMMISYESFAISIDSLRVEVRNLPNDSTKVSALIDLSKKFLKSQNDTSFCLARDAIKLSKDINYVKGYASALNQMGLVFKYQSELDSALFYYEESLRFFDSLGIDRDRASVLNRMGNIYKRRGDFSKSLEVFHLALDISKDICDTVMISALYNNISVLYKDSKNFDIALEYQMMNLEINRKQYPNSNLSSILMNIANIYKRMDQYDKANQYYKEALDYLKDDDNKYDRLLLAHNLGTVNEEIGKYSYAMEYYKKAIELCDELGNKEILIYSLQGIGNVLIKTGDFKEGEKYLLKSYGLAKEVGDLIKQSTLSLNLQKVYKQRGDYKQSLKYLELYDAVEDSIYNLNYIKQTTLLEQKYEAQKREQQIAFLEKEGEVQKLELEKKEIEARQKSLQRNILIIVVILILLFTAYFAYDSKKRKKINQLLIKQNKKIVEQRTEIANQNKELLESNKTKDRLFQIIAHDLRSPLVSIDSITQLIPYWIKEKDYESLMKLSETLELSVNNVISLIDNLLNWALNQQGKFPYRPENLKLKDNILEAIEIYKPIAEIKNIKLDFSYKKEVRVFADRNMLFTVMRNLLNNAIKFTPEKGSITVGMESNIQFAKVWVKDSGIGISKEKREEVFDLANGQKRGTKGETGRGLGLFFCKEFVKINNGDIFIESEKGTGTIITFTLPLFNLAEN